MKTRLTTVAVAAGLLGVSMFLFSGSLSAQQPEGPQTSAPAPVAPAPPPATAQGAGSNERISIPAGTRIGVVLENGVSMRAANPGDSGSVQTSLPRTHTNR